MIRSYTNPGTLYSTFDISNVELITVNNQKTETTSKKRQTYTQTKPNATKTWFRRLLHHPVRKQSGSILQLPDPHGALDDNK